MKENKNHKDDHYRQQRDSVFRYLSLITQLALTMIICILGFFFFGLWLGDRLGLQIPFMVVGLITGIGCGFYFSYRQITGLDDK